MHNYYLNTIRNMITILNLGYNLNITNMVNSSLKS